MIPDKGGANKAQKKFLKENRKKFKNNPNPNAKKAVRRWRIKLWKKRFKL